LKVSRQYMIEYLRTQPRAKQIQFVGRALVVIFNNQTSAEKQSDTTNEDNGIGFTGADAFGGGLTAKYFLKHKTLLDWQFEKWVKPNTRGVPRIVKYWKQLDAAAQAKVSKPVPKEPVMTQAIMDDIEAEMNRMDHEGEMTAERKAYEWKMQRDADAELRSERERRQVALEFAGRRQRNLGNRVESRRQIRGRADQRSL